MAVDKYPLVENEKMIPFSQRLIKKIPWKIGIFPYLISEADQNPQSELL